MSISGMAYVRPVYKAGWSVGTQMTTNATVSTASIPNDSSGNPTRWVMLGAVSTPVHVRLGATTATTCTVNDMLIGTTPIVVSSRGAAAIAIFPESGAGAKLNVSPLEDA